jgi:hypothetical protein
VIHAAAGPRQLDFADGRFRGVAGTMPGPLRRVGANRANTIRKYRLLAFDLEERRATGRSLDPSWALDCLASWLLALDF